MEPLLSARGPELLTQGRRKKEKTVKCVTRAKQDNAGHMDTNMLTHTVGHERTLYTVKTVLHTHNK